MVFFFVFVSVFFLLCMTFVFRETILYTYFHLFNHNGACVFAFKLTIFKVLVWCELLYSFYLCGSVWFVFSFYSEYNVLLPNFVVTVA